MPLADALATALLKQSIALAQVEAGAQDETEARLNKLWRLLRQALGDNDPTAPELTAQQLRQVRRFVEAMAPAIEDVYGELASADAVRRREVAVWYAQEVSAALNATAETTLIRRGRIVAQLAKMADDSLVLGAPAQDWWGRQAATVEQQLADRLRRAVLNEAPLRDLRIEITAVTDTATRAATAQVQTSLAQVSQGALDQVVQANPERLRYVQWVTTLDNAACVRCIGLSGQAWTIDRQPRGGSGRWPGPPPLHWNCRCVLLPLPPDEPLAQELTFETWLRTQPPQEQREVLGPGRFALWQAGKIKLRQLVDQRHRPLRLDALRSESAA